MPTRRVHALLDVVGEAELDARRMEGRIGDLSAWGAEHREVVDWLRRAVLNGAVWADLADAVHTLVLLDDRLNAATRELRSASEDAGSRLARVREATTPGTPAAARSTRPAPGSRGSAAPASSRRSSPASSTR